MGVGVGMVVMWIQSGKWSVVVLFFKLWENVCNRKIYCFNILSVQFISVKDINIVGQASCRIF